MSKIVGNEEVIARAKSLFTTNPCNAVFYGVKGIGKFTVAKELLSGFPEVLIVDGEEFNTESCNMLLTKLSIVPAGAEKRVVLIDNASSISEVVQNKLLKVVEDGQKHNIFVFIAHGFLLPTLISRSILLTFYPLCNAHKFAFLEEQGVPREQWSYYCMAMGDSIGSYYRVKEDVSLDTLLRSVYEMFSQNTVSELALLRAFDMVNEKSTAYERIEPNLDLIFRFFSGLLVDLSYGELGKIYEKQTPYGVEVAYDILSDAEDMWHDGLFTKQEFFKLLNVLGSC